jgi:uncharacterized protein with GYD domain
MPTYINLVKWTQQGIENVRESLVFGQYDMVVISEFPDDEAATKAGLILGSAGSVRTESCRAFTEDEYRKIIAALP